MFDNLEVMRMAHALAKHASSRHETIARNIANADTPGYRASDVASFQDTYRSEHGGAMRATRPRHFGAEAGVAADPRVVDAGGPASPNGNTVSLETEMVKSVETKLQHDMATSIYRASLDILRASIGRGR